ncbi:MAG: dicarboxylate/amino acid:cation symporter [Bacteroidales bacterium]
MIKRKFSLAMHWQILIMLALGGLFGYFFPHLTKYTNWMGDIFLRGLNMVIVPLIFCSIMTGVASVGTAENLGRLGLKTMGYYVLSTLLAIITGFVFVQLIKPGVGADLGLQVPVEEISVGRESFGQTLINIVPTNIIRAMSEAQMLSIIFFAILAGFFVTRVGEKSRVLLVDVVNSILDVIMKITLFVIKFTPLGVFSIIAKVISQQINNGNQVSEVISSMGIYFLTVLLGLVVQGMITLPLLVRFLGRANPMKHLKNMSTVILTAFSTSSSNATLPLTMETVETRNGVSNKIASFTLPLGATINMNGTALYECVAVMFIAQAYGIDLTFGQRRWLLYSLPR